MAKVTGIGGIFWKSADTAATNAWYAQHLGVPAGEWGWNFEWRDKETGAPGTTVWSPFKADTKYFEPSSQPFMINYRVDDLPALIEQLAAAGIPLVGEMQDEPYGRFAWIIDPDGTKIELWEPKETPPEQEGADE